MATTDTQRPKSILVILRRVYLEIVGGNHCAAKLIEYFKHWREWKFKVHRTEWVYMPVRQIYEDLMGEHSVNIIRRAINKLLDLGILEHRHDPGNGQDKTWQYRINLEVLQTLLDPNDKADVKTDRPLIRSDQSYIHKISPLDSNPNISNSESETEAKELESQEPEPTSELSVSSKVKTEFSRPKRKEPLLDKSSTAVEVWEVESGQPYPYFLQWRALHYKNQGGHWANSPESNAYAEFYKNRFKTSILWREFLQFYNLALDNALALQAAGIEVKLPSCFSDRTPATEEEVASKAQTLEQTRPKEPPKPAPRPVGFFADVRRILSLPRAKTEDSPSVDPLQKYLEWLRSDDPILVKEARCKLGRMVMEQDDLEPVWDENGSLIDVVQLGSG